LILAMSRMSRVEDTNPVEDDDEPTPSPSHAPDDVAHSSEVEEMMSDSDNEEPNPFEDIDMITYVPAPVARATTESVHAHEAPVHGHVPAHPRAAVPARSPVPPSVTPPPRHHTTAAASSATSSSAPTSRRNSTNPFDWPNSPPADAAAVAAARVETQHQTPPPSHTDPYSHRSSTPPLSSSSATHVVPSSHPHLHPHQLAPHSQPQPHVPLAPSRHIGGSPAGSRRGSGQYMMNINRPPTHTATPAGARTPPIAHSRTAHHHPPSHAAASSSRSRSHSPSSSSPSLPPAQAPPSSAPPSASIRMRNNTLVPPTPPVNVPSGSVSASGSLRKSTSKSRMESFIRSHMVELEKRGEKLVKSVRGLDEEEYEEEGSATGQHGATGADGAASSAAHDHPMHRRHRVEDEQLATLNYDALEDYVAQTSLAGEDPKAAKRHGYVLTLLQLLLTMLIAFAIAITMYCVVHIFEFLNNARVDSTLNLIHQDRPYAAYFSLLGLSLLFAGMSATLIAYCAPQARGAGVPYVQAYLNGTNVSSYFCKRIVLIKILALGPAVASGMTVGMEGPFVFIGSGLAILISKALDLFTFRRKQLGGRYARILKNINEERVFMAGGMAAGLACAFNAPIAGVMMALEGSTSFLTVPVVIRIFGCAMFASFFNDLGHVGWSSSKIKTHNLIVITQEVASRRPHYAWMLWELAPFTLLAILAGVLSAFAIWVNVRLAKWRHARMEDPRRHRLDAKAAVAEVLFWAFITSTIWFILPWVFGCQMQHEQCFPNMAVPVRCERVHCPDKFYSAVGNLVYSPPDTIARILFDRTLEPHNELDPFALSVYAAFYLVLGAAGYGAHVPGGLFVPAIVFGGCMGRVVGWCVLTYVSSSINPGVYALLGAACMLGGFTRLAMPCVIMLIEMTGDATYLLPIMFCTVLSKVVSDQFVPPLYPQHMAIEGIPTLGDKLHPLIAPLRAKHIMNRHFYSVHPIDTLEHLLDVLDKSRSILLPVVTKGDGKFVGMIMRRSVIYAMKYTKFYASEEELRRETLAAEAERALLKEELGTGSANSSATSSGVNRLLSFLSSTPAPSSSSSSSVAGPGSAPSLLDVDRKMGDWSDTTDYRKTIGTFDDKYAKYLINLTPFMDAGALSGHEETSAKRIAAIFRRLGISHLGVCDEHNKLVGVITRRHLIKPPPRAKEIIATAAAAAAAAAAGGTGTPPRERAGSRADGGGGGDAGVTVPVPGVEDVDSDVIADLSPEVAADLARYDPSREFEATASEVAMHRRRASTWRGGIQSNASLPAASSTMGAVSMLSPTRESTLEDEHEPTVRFDDEEDDDDRHDDESNDGTSAALLTTATTVTGSAHVPEMTFGSEDVHAMAEPMVELTHIGSSSSSSSSISPTRHSADYAGPVDDRFRATALRSHTAASPYMTSRSSLSATASSSPLTITRTGSVRATPKQSSLSRLHSYTKQIE